MQSRNDLVVTLTYEQICECETYAQKAHEIAAKRQQKDCSLRPDRGQMLHTLGRAAEIAVAACFNLPLRHDFGIGGPDFIKGSSRIDVKATDDHNRDALLLTLAARSRNPGIDVYVMTTVDLPRVRIVGFALARELLAAPVVDLGYGPTYSLPFSALHTFDHATKQHATDCPVCRKTPAVEWNDDLRSWRAEYEAAELRHGGAP